MLFHMLFMLKYAEKYASRIDISNVELADEAELVSLAVG